MKCLNMKIPEILFFLLNFITTYQEDKIYQTTTSVDELVNQFHCPNISKIIHENNLANYAINCKPLNKKYYVMNIDTVLQHACFIVNDMLNYMCENKFNVSSDLFKIDKYDSICPFNFSYLEQLNFTFRNKKIPSELTNPDHCSKVCSDLYSNKTQCVILSKLNHYLKNLTSSATEKVFSPKLKKPSAKSEPPKVLNVLANALQKKKEKSILSAPKEVIAQEKLELDDPKVSEPILKMPEQATEDEKKLEKPISTTTSKVEGKSHQFEGGTKMARNENNIEEMNDIKLKDDPDEEEQINNENDKTVSDDSFSEKADLNLDSNKPKIATFEDKIEVSHEGKEIYSGEGFFQAEDSHFFFYFIMVSSVIVVGYLAFHNKNKILAYALEGTSGRRNRRRFNPARYRKLETNLEEAISSNATNTEVSSVVY